MIESLDPDDVGALERPRGMVVTDLDGTLLGTSHALAPVDREALERVGRAGYLRVVATGRNPHSYRRAQAEGFPIDYAILSSGGAIRMESTGRYLRTVSLEPEEVWPPAEVLLSLDLDLMILDPLPDNHRFAHYPATAPSADYWKRIEIYAGFGRPLMPRGWPRLGDQGRVRELWKGAASQLLGMEPAGSSRDVIAAVRPRLPGYTVLRSTSPLGSGATWVEIFPANVSKSQAAAWLARRVGLTARDVLCVGNDYNDEDLLEWGGTSCVVANAPEDLRARFTTVASADEGGLAEAVARWLPGLL